MSKYQNYSLRQLFEAIRTGRTDVGVRAGEEIKRRIEELETQNAALLAALEPFAKCLPSDIRFDTNADHPIKITVCLKDIKAARRATTTHDLTIPPNG